MRNSRQMVGNLTNLLRKNIGLNNDEKEENNENNDENSGGKHWTFRQINEQTNGFFENFLSSNANKDMIAFDQMADITVGEGTTSSSAAGQQNQQQADDAHQCAICLLEIEPGTVIKQLPACQHFFHIDCIRIWLRGYNNFCPMCRAKIFSEYKDGKVELNTQKQNYGTFDENV
ncbi:hypothetical protein niasHS_017275 [Heterodera schachtii]|uniref:RING-type domain-containing protein n=1 Tax=Heterodera schachtii TaxID=97005 RepID=A0ABD2HY80_HETSC